MQTPVIPATRRQLQKGDSKFAVSLVYLANARLAGDILSQMSNSIKQRPRAQVSRETWIQIRRLAHRCYERKNLATAERGKGDRKFLLE